MQYEGEEGLENSKPWRKRDCILLVELPTFKISPTLAGPWPQTNARQKEMLQSASRKRAG